jgi:hypothetical protein
MCRCNPTAIINNKTKQESVMSEQQSHEQASSSPDNTVDVVATITCISLAVAAMVYWLSGL